MIAPSPYVNGGGQPGSHLVTPTLFVPPAAETATSEGESAALAPPVVTSTVSPAATEVRNPVRQILPSPYVNSGGPPGSYLSSPHDEEAITDFSPYPVGTVTARPLDSNEPTVVQSGPVRQILASPYVNSGAQTEDKVLQFPSRPKTDELAPFVSAALGGPGSTAREILAPGTGPVAAVASGEINQAELAKAARAAGIPNVIFQRSFANFQKNRSDGKSARGCFMAADLTTPDQGRMWMLCAGSPAKVMTLPTQWGSGMGKGCQQHLFQNRGKCARFFGDRPGYCLPAGGNYVTGLATKTKGAQRFFVDLIGQDRDNENATERHTGIHETLTKQGQQADASTVNWFDVSQGCFTLPTQLKEFSPADLSSKAPAGGLALYVYPGRDEIEKLRRKEAVPYWDETCREDLAEHPPGWLGSKTSSAPSVSQMESEGVTDTVASDQRRAQARAQDQVRGSASVGREDGVR